MLNYSHKPTEENAILFLQKDPLRRKDSVLRFIDLLCNINESCSIAINGEWGSGKTFFVKQVKAILDALNPCSTMDVETRNKIKELCTTVNPNAESFSTLYYDAWLFDDHNDPILSLIYAAIKSNQCDFMINEEKRSLLDCAGAIADAVTGRNISSILHEVRGKDTFEELKSAEEIREMMGNFINTLIEERGNRLVIFIDELDRCKPDYSIRFMERIKHYFDDERITFVFSTSIAQLQCTVKKYYGNEFNATRYLDKLFDLQISLPEVNLEQFMNYQLNFNQSNYRMLSGICFSTAKVLNLSLRETERYVRLIKIANLFDYKYSWRSDSQRNGGLFSLVYFLPVLIGLQLTEINMFNDFISGRENGIIDKIFSDPCIKHMHEFFTKPYEKIDEEIEPILKKIKDAYNAVFIKQYAHSEDLVSVGNMVFTMLTKKHLMTVFSLISQTSNYSFD